MSDITADDLKRLQRIGPIDSDFYGDIAREVCRLAGFDSVIIGKGLLYHMDVYGSKDVDQPYGKVVMTFKESKVWVSGYRFGPKCVWNDSYHLEKNRKVFDLSNPNSFKNISEYIGKLVEAKFQT